MKQRSAALSAPHRTALRACALIGLFAGWQPTTTLAAQAPESPALELVLRAGGTDQPLEGARLNWQDSAQVMKSSTTGRVALGCALWCRRAS